MRQIRSVDAGKNMKYTKSVCVTSAMVICLMKQRNADL